MGSTVINYTFFKLIAHFVKNNLKKNKVIWLR